MSRVDGHQGLNDLENVLFIRTPFLKLHHKLIQCPTINSKMQSNNFPHHRIEVGYKSNKLPNALISLPLPQRAKKILQKTLWLFYALDKNNYFTVIVTGSVYQTSRSIYGEKNAKINTYM
jgi:hypothetical protein